MEVDEKILKFKNLCGTFHRYSVNISQTNVETFSYKTEDFHLMYI